MILSTKLNQTRFVVFVLYQLNQVFSKTPGVFGPIKSPPGAREAPGACGLQAALQPRGIREDKSSLEWRDGKGWDLVTWFFVASFFF